MQIGKCASPASASGEADRQGIAPGSLDPGPALPRQRCAGPPDGHAVGLDDHPIFILQPQLRGPGPAQGSSEGAGPSIPPGIAAGHADAIFQQADAGHAARPCARVLMA